MSGILSAYPIFFLFNYKFSNLAKESIKRKPVYNACEVCLKKVQ